MAETVTLNTYICLQGRGGWKIGPRYVRTKWMSQTNVVKYFAHWYGQVY